MVHCRPCLILRRHQPVEQPRGIVAQLPRTQAVARSLRGPRFSQLVDACQDAPAGLTPPPA